MLDLKAKLAAAGLVSPEELARAEAERGKKKGRGPRGGKKGGGPRGGQGQPQGARSARPGSPTAAATLDVASLAKLDPKLDKNKLYDAVRRFVDATRLDPLGRTPSEHARNFHFPTEAGAIGRLVIEPHLSHALAGGEAAVVAYMSNHGLAHAVVSADGARAIAKLFPTWPRTGPSAQPPPEPEPEAEARADTAGPSDGTPDELEGGAEGSDAS
jgi:hypothetical protein